MTEPKPKYLSSTDTYIDKLEGLLREALVGVEYLENDYCPEHTRHLADRIRAALEEGA